MYSDQPSSSKAQSIHRSEKRWRQVLYVIIKMHRNVLKISNLAYVSLFVQGKIRKKIMAFMCLLALGLQGIVIKCTVAIFFLTVGYPIQRLVKLLDPQYSIAMK